MSLFTRTLSEPGKALSVATAILKGHFYKIYLPLRGLRFRAGRGLRVYGRIMMKGPGQVVFGDGVIVYGKITPWTYRLDAVISVGDGTWLTSTRFGCAARIAVGRVGMLSDAQLLDTDHHTMQTNRRDPTAPIRVDPVEVGDNVWIGSSAVILPGSRIGANSVVSIMSVCSGKYPDDVILVGHPARAVGRVPGPDGVVPPPAAPAGRGASPRAGVVPTSSSVTSAGSAVAAAE